MTSKTAKQKSVEKVPIVFKTGKWGEEQQGVKFLSFEMPMRDDEHITFGFTSPDKKAEGEVRITNVGELMGVILLFKPKQDDKKATSASEEQTTA